MSTRTYTPGEYEEAAANVEAALRVGDKVPSITLDRLPTMLREAAEEAKAANARAAATAAITMENATLTSRPHIESPPPDEPHVPPPPSTKPEKPAA